MCVFVDDCLIRASQKPKWIKVKDHLPSPKKKMLKTNQDSKQNLFLNLEIKKTYFQKKKYKGKYFLIFYSIKDFVIFPVKLIKWFNVPSVSHQKTSK